ncbi:TetR/AcrR family transcriptional regulator [Streptomyces abyssomicinicus]|uniref:TetR/AcrR family transcriptional regulator n=1 Tax=Streptomyces abyssomicinicus TaxID=574929 RepID=UPI001250A62D|nr:TetR/AcrR family transcriptional regulator [Streptomyces abyssomicinicus]
MHTARDTLLEAAGKALERQSWAVVRMVDVAAAAGVSRQTLYNEFGSKEGLGRALVRREADAYLAGLDRALASRTDPWERLAAVAEWTARAGRGGALARAVLTGCWNERLPAPVLTAVPSSSTTPAQRRADGPLPSPAELVVLARERAVAALAAPPGALGVPPARTESRAWGRACELAVRVGLSCVVAPPGPGTSVSDLVRSALPRRVAGGVV